MFPNATVSSRGSSSSRSGNSCERNNTSMPSLHVRSPLSLRTSVNPLFRHSDSPHFTSFDASHFVVPKPRMSDRRNHILKRYHSHEAGTNYDDTSGESKDNSPDSTNERINLKSGFGSSPESTGDRGKRTELEARDFLERYSLPRVVRVEDSEPLLLYRCFDSFTKVQARGIIGKKGKEKTDSNVLHFPEGYPGWFSMVGEKGERSAAQHTTLLQLVREQVCSFLSLSSFTAYTAHPPDPQDKLGRVQYLKTTVRGGQVFRLRAVFQHRDKADDCRQSSRSKITSRSRDLANRYAQLVDHNNQELYAPLTTKGEFYEIHTSAKSRLCFPGLLDKTGPLALDKDCLYRLGQLLRRVALPFKVKLMCGPLPSGLPKDFPDIFVLEKKFQEPLLVTCTLPSPSEGIKHEISCFNMNSGLKLSRSMLGFDTEHRLFKSQRLQSALAYCQKNVEHWYREVRLLPNLEKEIVVIRNRRSQIIEEVCSDCRRNNRTCGSICKSRLREAESEVVNCGEEQPPAARQIITKEVIEKFPKSRKWYRHFKILGVGGDSAAEKLKAKDEKVDVADKVRSIDRYKDMSKLIEEKFGKRHSNPVKKSASFMFSTKRIDLEEVPTTGSKDNPALLKCQSLDTQLNYHDDGHRRGFGERSRADRLSMSRSNLSDTLSLDFQMCILENDGVTVEQPAAKPTTTKTDALKAQGRSLKDLRDSGTHQDLDEIRSLEECQPDLIPQKKRTENSYISERLYSEFHVKTKVQKRPGAAANNRSSANLKSIAEGKVAEVVQNRALPNVDELPYSHVLDEVCEAPDGRSGIDAENIYAEICDPNACTCAVGEKCTRCQKVYKHKRGADEYCYVKLGSNGDSITQSSDEEAIYNTLR